jgi:hypothetical protein
MRILKLCIYALLLLVIALALAFFVAIRNENRIAQLALARIYDRTGLEITISGTRIGFGTHLAIILEDPRVSMRGAPVGSLQAIRASLNYIAIFRRSGLPLARLELDRPRVQLPARALEITTGGIPRLDANALKVLNWGLDALSDTVQRFDVIDGILSDRDGLTLVDQFDLRARRQHYHRAGSWPWLLDFNGALEQPPVHDLQLAGHLRLGAQPRHQGSILGGRLWFWGWHIHNLQLGPTLTSALLNGDLRLTMNATGSVDGDSHISLQRLTVSLRNGEPVIPSTDYQISSTYHVSADEIDIPALTFQRGTTDLLSGAAAVLQPYSSDRRARLSLRGAQLELSRLFGLLPHLPGIPSILVRHGAQVTGGNLTVSGLSLETSIPIRNWTFATLRDHLRAEATINNAAFEFPPALRLPPLQKLTFQLNYDSGSLNLAQGSFLLGASQINDLAASLDLHNAPARIGYRTSARGELDLTNFTPLIRTILQSASPAVSVRLATLSGRLVVAARAEGAIQDLRWKLAQSYLAEVYPHQLSAQLKGMPSTILMTDGAISLKPSLMTVTRLRILVGENGGEVLLDGSFEPRPGAARLKNFTAELHQVPVERWLPLLIDPDSLSADGRLGGLLAAKGELSQRSTPQITGKLTLGAGHVTFGFLRAPIKVRAATLTFDGKGLVLKMPGSSLEDQALDFRLAVADFAHPSVRIDARAAKLDLFVMRFIRAPWTPPSVPHFFAVPVSGHLEADQASFDKLMMSKVATDFSRDQVNWRVYDFTGRAFDGSINLNIDGRTGPNNWIRMKGAVSNIDTALLLEASDPVSRPAVIGSLSMAYDLWANTDTDFFDTLAGSFSLQINDGVLQRFALLSKILSFIDLKNWITAQFPDPRISGVPFETITADFKGVKGDFYTDNLLLTGPVMDISARGSVRFGQGRIDMDVGMVPFSTVNWFVSHIPLVGANLAGGTRGLVGAYFHVYGPYKDPTVRPKPITSVTEFVKRTLGLPVNIIAPHTIK